MGLEYRAQADVCRLVFQNLPSERNIEVVTFNRKCVQSNVTKSQEGAEWLCNCPIHLYYTITSSLN